MDVPKASFSMASGTNAAALAENGPAPSIDGNTKLNSPYDVLKETLKNYWVKVALQMVGFFLFFLTGCLYYHHVEGWSVGTCIMFTVVTISTVGYGYQFPTTNNARIFTIFYIIVGVYFVFFSVSNAIAANFEAVKKYVEQKSMSETIGRNVNRHRYTFFCTLASIVVCTFIAGGIFHSLEEWSFIESVYFAVETSTSVGYGDLDINNADSTFAFVIFYIIFSTVLFAFAFNTFNLIQEEVKQLKKEQEILEKKQNMGFIAELDKGKGVTEHQFILAVLEHLGTLDYEKDVLPWKEKFQEMDTAGTGRVFHQALEGMSSRESMYAGDKLARLNSYQNNNPASAVTSLVRGSFMGGPSEIRSPIIRDTFNAPRATDLHALERLSVAQTNLLSHYA